MMKTAHRRPHSVLVLGLMLALAGCTSVDMVRLTSQQFPPKRSVEDVEVLQQVPACPHVALAELRVEDTSSGYGAMQQNMLEKAAGLGADAVVFAKPEEQIQHQVTYQPGMMMGGPFGYGGFGYGGMMYGPYPYGMGYYGGYPAYGGGAAVPYDVEVKSLKGLAIRYIQSSGPKC
jgi:hypothetical protein